MHPGLVASTGRLGRQGLRSRTRDNVMRQMTSIRDLQLPMMLPGILWNTGADDYFLIESAQLARFDGKQWVRFGKIIGH